METKKYVGWAFLLILSIGSFHPLMAQEEEIPITTSSEEALILYQLGRELSENLRTGESVSYFEKAILKDPNFAMAYLQLAVAQDTEAKYFEYLDKAMACAEKVSEGEKLMIQGFWAGIHDNLTKQKELSQKLVKLYPRDKRARASLGNYYFVQQEYDMAVKEYLKAIEIDPDFAPPYNLLGYSYSYLGNYQEAEKVMSRYRKLIPDEPNPLDSLGEILMKQGKFDESIKAYQNALAVNPKFYWSYVGIGTNLMLKEKHEEARKEFQKCLDQVDNDDDRRQAFLSMAASYIEEGKFNKALDVLQKRYAVADEENNTLGMTEALELMGDILLEIGKIDEAKQKYFKASDIIEKSDISKEVKEDAKQNLLFNEVQVALGNKDLTTAKQKTEEYKKQAEAGHDPSEMLLYHQLAGMIALQEKRYNDAIQQLQKSNLQNPFNLYRLAEAYAGKGDQSKAKEMWTKAAHFNEIVFDYAYVRKKAQKKLTK